MPSIPNNVEWSATAAWIALAISIIGTISSPLITTLLTNRHQLKLYKLNIQHGSLEKYEDRRFQAINSFFQKVGGCFSCSDARDLHECGSVFHCVYQYVPETLWDKLDALYASIICKDLQTARKLYPPIARDLAAILREPPPLNP